MSFLKDTFITVLVDSTRNAVSVVGSGAWGELSAKQRQMVGYLSWWGSRGSLRRTEVIRGGQQQIGEGSPGRL